MPRLARPLSTPHRLEGEHQQPGAVCACCPALAVPRRPPHGLRGPPGVQHAMHARQQRPRGLQERNGRMPPPQPTAAWGGAPRRAASAAAMRMSGWRACRRAPHVRCSWAARRRWRQRSARPRGARSWPTRLSMRAAAGGAAQQGTQPHSSHGIAARLHAAVASPPVQLAAPPLLEPRAAAPCCVLQVSGAGW